MARRMRLALEIYYSPGISSLGEPLKRVQTGKSDRGSQSDPSPVRGIPGGPVRSTGESSQRLNRLAGLPTHSGGPACDRNRLYSYSSGAAKSSRRTARPDFSTAAGLPISFETLVSKWSRRSLSTLNRAVTRRLWCWSKATLKSPSPKPLNRAGE